MSSQIEALNKWVFRLLLKESDEEQFFTAEGKLFHKVGAAWPKARVPHIVVNLGIIREPELDERKDLAGM